MNMVLNAGGFAGICAIIMGLSGGSWNDTLIAAVFSASGYITAALEAREDNDDC